MHRPSSVAEIEAAANEALHDTALLHAEIKNALTQGETHRPSAEQLEQWRTTVLRTNRAVSRIARIAWMADDRRSIEHNILLENVKRDALDREATFAHTWAKLRQQASTLSVDAPSVSIDRALLAAHQVESAMAALAPVPDTQYHGAPSLALLQ